MEELNCICKSCLHPVEDKNRHHLLLYRCYKCRRDFAVDLDSARSAKSIYIKIFCTYCGVEIDTGLK